MKYMVMMMTAKANKTISPVPKFIPKSLTLMTVSSPYAIADPVAWHHADPLMPAAPASP